MSPRPDTRERGRARELAIVAAAALVVAVVLTWPLAREAGSRLPHDPRFVAAEGADTHVFHWNCWWARRAVERGGDPFWSTAIFHPRGHSLALHTHTMLWALASVPLQWVLGLPAAYGVLLLLLFAATAAATFALARGIGIGRAGAAFAAFAWTFSPYFVQKGLEHLNLFATPWPPLFLLCLLRWMDARSPGSDGSEASTRRALLAALGAGAVLGLSLLTSMLSSLYVLVLGACVLVLAPSPAPDATRARRRGLLVPGAWVLAALATLAIAWPWLASVHRDWGALAETASREQLYHPRLVDFVTPPGLHPLFAGLGAGAPIEGHSWTGHRGENAGLYLAASVIALFATALVFVPRARRWVLVALPPFLLAWDPGPDPGGWLSNVYRHMPVLELLRVPARAWPYALLPLALAAGLGFELLTRRRATRAAAALLAALLVFESWTVSYPTMSAEPPLAVRAIARAEADGAVLFLPFAPGAHVSMTWQTRHERPVLVSYVARSDPARFREWQRTLPDLFLLAQGARIPGARQLAVDLACADVAHVLVREDDLADPGLLYRVLDEMEGWERAETDDGVAWWYDTARLFSARPILEELEGS